MQGKRRSNLPNLDPHCKKRRFRKRQSLAYEMEQFVRIFDEWVRLHKKSVEF